MIYEKEFNTICKEVYDQILKEYPHFADQLTETKVREMVKDAYKCVQDHIVEGSLAPVYFQSLGRFVVKEGRKEWLKNKRNDIKK